ncbi:DUF7673 family protein [Pseudomonas schmalbachii]|uniref:DUF7673 domain-containing protein n=1 Tax=Pseudomonas schmalbachii TaxID=2816993 RepID=A0ABS3TKI5_9PSED|nr:hypothetical protein [Pseudomonas schmalbachii]MBO3274167.1 hypothetical protein [Pseudomonas schmalbachii]
MPPSDCIPHALSEALTYLDRRPAIVSAGTDALRRLIPVALRPTGQGGVIGRFLLGLYNGQDYPFDLTDLRRLDLALFDDCLQVLQMDFQPEVEVHGRVADGQAIWAELVILWAPREPT